MWTIFQAEGDARQFAVGPGGAFPATPTSVRELAAAGLLRGDGKAVSVSPWTLWQVTGGDKAGLVSKPA